MRSLFPLLALVGIVALPASLAQDRQERNPGPVAATLPVPAQREAVVVRLAHSDARRLGQALSDALAQEPAGPGGPFRVTPEPETNSLVLNGSNDAIRRAMALIKDLDRSSTSSRQTEVIRLKHARAKDLAEILRMIGSQQVQGTNSALPGIAVDDRTATLVLTGDASSLAALKTLIVGLDVPAANADAGASTSAQARITVYEVDLPAEQAAALSSKGLSTTARDEKSLLSGLMKLGSTKQLFTMDQQVDLANRDTIQISSQIPVVDESAPRNDEASKQKAGYQNIGCKVELGGRRPSAKPGGDDAGIRVELSSVQSATGNAAGFPILHRIQQNYAGTCSLDDPIILVSTETSPARSVATAFVTRIEFSRPAAGG